MCVWGGPLAPRHMCGWGGGGALVLRHIMGVGWEALALRHMIEVCGVGGHWF